MVRLTGLHAAGSDGSPLLVLPTDDPLVEAVRRAPAIEATPHAPAPDLPAIVEARDLYPVPQPASVLPHRNLTHRTEPSAGIVPGRLDRYGLELCVRTVAGSHQARVSFPAAITHVDQLPGAMQALLRRAAACCGGPADPGR